MSIQNLLLLLAASAASDNDIEDLFEWVEQVGALQGANSVRELRHRAKLVRTTPSRSPFRKAIIPERQMSQRTSDSSHASMIDAVEKLLLKECQLSKAQAARALINGLKDVNYEYDNLPAPNKMSFRRWLARIGDIVSDSQILHISSKIRNDVIHGKRPISDWPI